MAKKAVEPVEGEEIAAVTVLPPEVEEKVNLEISTALAEFNWTEEFIKRLEEEYAPMIIKGQDDKEGYLNLQVARKAIKNVRVAISKRFKVGREEAQLIVKTWIAKEGEVVGKLKSIEDPLYDQEKAWEAERDRQKAERLAKIEQQGVARMSDLIRFGAALQGSNWVLGDIQYEAQLVKEADPEIYEGIRSEFEAFYNEKEAVRLENERVQQEQQAELQRKQQQFEEQQATFQRQQEEFKKQQQAARVKGRTAFVEGAGLSKHPHSGHYVYGDQRVTLEEIEGKDDADWEIIAAGIIAGVAEVKKAAEEANRVREVFAARLPLLKEWSSNGQSVYAKGGVWGTVADIVNMPADQFEELVKENDAFIRERNLEVERIRQQEVKDAADQSTGISRLKALRELEGTHEGTALEVGRLTEEEWAPIFLKAKQARDQKEERDRLQRELEEKERLRLLKEKEMAESGDKAKYADTIKYLLATPIHSMASGQYRAKIRIIQDWINGLK